MFTRLFITATAAAILLMGSLPVKAQDGHHSPGARLSAGLGGTLEAGVNCASGPGNGILTSHFPPRMGRAEAYRLKVARESQRPAYLTSRR
jgi:hypothetical protein